MANRDDLHEILVNLLGSRYVYYQPPSNITMNYPAIVYSKSDVSSRYANDSAYSIKHKYQIIVIDRDPDNIVIDKLMGLPYSSYDRHYTSDNLHHDVLTLYF